MFQIKYRFRHERLGLLQHLAHQAEAVAVHAAAGHTDHAVARLDALAVNELIFFDDGHAKAGEVVTPLGIEPRHLGGFSAEQGTAALPASIGDSLNDLSHRRRR